MNKQRISDVFRTVEIIVFLFLILTNSMFGIITVNTVEEPKDNSVFGWVIGGDDER